MAQLIRDIRKFTELFARDPRDALLRARHKIVGAPVKAIDNRISATLEERAAALTASRAERVAVYGGLDFRDAAAKAVEMTVWLSDRSHDIEAGAVPATGLASGTVDAVLVGGPNVSTSYRNVLRILSSWQNAIPVYWVGEGFEFCGSTLGLPSLATDADIYLYNHFEEFFLLRDPLQVHVRIGDQERVDRHSIIIRPGCSACVRLSDVFGEFVGPAFVEIRTEHPVLTRRRHPRWRMTADVFAGNLMTTLHGGHDFDGPKPKSYMRWPSPGLPGDWTVTLPNYAMDAGRAESGVEIKAGGRTASFSRSTEMPVSEIEIRTGAAGGDSIGYRYRGYGCSFIYGHAIGAAPDAQVGKTFVGNHEIFLSPAPVTGAESTPSETETLQSLRERGFVLTPYAVPICDQGDGVEFGIAFASANPAIEELDVALFDGEGKCVARFEEKTGAGGVLYGDALRLAGGAAAASAGLAIVSPRWHTTGYHPNRATGQPDLVVRRRDSEDRDITEFQSSWRNNGVDIPEFPHWLTREQSVVGRTRHVGRVVCGQRGRTAVSIANASGNLNYTGTADVQVTLRHPAGKVLTGNCTISAFTQQLVWLDELFGDLGDFLDTNWGSLSVSSYDADLNCQMVTVNSAGSVSLQHMWGY